MMYVRSLAALSAVSLVCLAPVRVEAADVSAISADDFYGATYFKSALEHPQVAKQKSRDRQMRLVARDLGWKKKKLIAAVDKVEELGGDPIALAKKAILTGAEGSRVKGRVLDVLLNDAEPKHVVAYVRFRGTKSSEVVKDAATLAAIIAERAPLVSTLSLSAIHPKAPPSSKTSVWSGKIGAPAMGRIQKSRIEDYAERLYGRLFEGVTSRPF